MKNFRSYSELSKISDFYERYRYLKLNSRVGYETFGTERYLNQVFYRSSKWRSARDKVIIRDNGCDLGVEGFDIHDKIIVHHINVVTIEDIERERSWLFDPEFLICTSSRTHNAIHYGDESTLPQLLITRRPNDTCPWK